MNRSLVFGGVSSILIALLHIAIIIGGPQWYRFFGAGERMTTLAEQGSWIPGACTSCIVLLFVIWGLYAFSGAHLIRRLPLLKLALITISAIYLVRGLALFPVWIFGLEEIDGLLIWSSLVSLGVGLAYALGTKKSGRVHSMRQISLK